MRKSQILLIALTLVLMVSGSIFAAMDPIVVLVMSGPEADGLRRVVEQYTRETGNPVEVMEVGRQVQRNLLTQLLLSGSDTIDLGYTSSMELATFQAAGVIEPLDAYMANSAITDPGFNRDDYLVWHQIGGQTYAIPFEASMHYMFYRKDLIPNPPQTWDEYIEVAKQFTRSQNPQSPTLYGTSMTGLIGVEPTKVFASLAFTYGGDLISEDGTVLLDSPETIEAAKLLQTMRDEQVLSPEILSIGFSEVQEALTSGQVAMAAPYWSAAYPLLTPEEQERIGITQIPGVVMPDGSIRRRSFVQSMTLVMNAGSKRKEAAWRFLSYLAGSKGAELFAEGGGAPPLASILLDADWQERRPEFRLIAEVLQNSQSVAPTTIYPAIQESFNSAFANLMSGKIDAEAAMKQAADAIRDLQ